MAKPTAEKQQPPRTGTISLVEASLGGVYSCQDKIAEATALTKKSADDFERISGPQNPGLIPRLGNLGTLYMEQDNDQSALDQFKRALSIAQANFGEHHLEYAQCQVRLGDQFRKMNRYEDAQQQIKQALTTEIQALGGHHPEVATTYVMTGWLRMDEGKFKDAESAYNHAMSIYEADPQAPNQYLSDAVLGLADCYVKEQRFSEAQKMLDKAASISRTMENPISGQSLEVTADLKAAQGKLSEADDLYKQRLAKYEAIYGPEHYRIPKLLNKYAALLTKENKKAEADKLRKRAALILEKRHHPVDSH